MTTPAEGGTILVFIPYYLPGYKGGGPVSSIANIVEVLGDSFKFLIVTSDRDVGDERPYQNTPIDEWVPVGKSLVRYLSPEYRTMKKLMDFIDDTSHDVFYLNSFFDSVFTIKVMFGRRFRRIKPKPLIIAPRGEFIAGSLYLKYWKKWIYIKLTRIAGFYRDVIWHASSDYERECIIKVMGLNVSVAEASDIENRRSQFIHVALPLSGKVVASPSPQNSSRTEILETSACHQNLRIVYLARLTREKNLDKALKILTKVRAKVTFDIFGPAEDDVYWRECKKWISLLPSNVIATHHGSLDPGLVLSTLEKFDLLLFPTRSENYGHAIAESLAAGTQVLISTETPWRDLESKGLGWDIDLENEKRFVEVIEGLALMSMKQLETRRAVVLREIIPILSNPAIVEANRQLFHFALSRKR